VGQDNTTYADKEGAARVCDGAARALFREFAFTNFEALPLKQESPRFSGGERQLSDAVL